MSAYETDRTRDHTSSKSSAILYEKGIELELSGDEVYYTNIFVLLVKNMLCGKFHYQKVNSNGSYGRKSLGFSYMGE